MRSTVSPATEHAAAVTVLLLLTLKLTQLVSLEKRLQQLRVTLGHLPVSAFCVEGRLIQDEIYCVPCNRACSNCDWATVDESLLGHLVIGLLFLRQRASHSS